MKIYIHSQTTAGEIRQQFAAVFPFLTIRFCDKPHRQGEEIKKGHWFADKIRLSSVQKRQSDLPLQIHPWQQTGYVEKAFEDVFGLHAQIFRREDDRWIQTAGTDELTLEEQNAIGREWEQQQQGLRRFEQQKRL